MCEVLHGEISAEKLIRPGGDDLALLSKGRPSRCAATSGHARRIGTVTLRLAEPPDFAVLADWLGGLVAAHGASMLRVKGIVRLRGETRPLAVHGVQHVFHPPTRLAAWPEGLADSTLVFILDGLDPAIILETAEEAGIELARHTTA
jgi:G3E family GTPase